MCVLAGVATLVRLSLCLATQSLPQSLCARESERKGGERGWWWGGGGVGWEVTFNSLITVRVRAVGVVGGWDG